jgi:hypothetical protein
MRNAFERPFEIDFEVKMDSSFFIEVVFEGLLG